MARSWLVAFFVILFYSPPLEALHSSVDPTNTGNSDGVIPGASGRVHDQAAWTSQAGGEDIGSAKLDDDVSKDDDGVDESIEEAADEVDAENDDYDLEDVSLTEHNGDQDEKAQSGDDDEDDYFVGEGHHRHHDNQIRDQNDDRKHRHKDNTHQQKADNTSRNARQLDAGKTGSSGDGEDRKNVAAMGASFIDRTADSSTDGMSNDDDEGDDDDNEDDNDDDYDDVDIDDMDIDTDVGEFSDIEDTADVDEFEDASFADHVTEEDEEVPEEDDEFDEDDSDFDGDDEDYSDDVVGGIEGDDDVADEDIDDVGDEVDSDIAEGVAEEAAVDGGSTS